ncbi:MAG: NYN domain-containing protein [bacterium]|nr:NYN domain-containing protein [bacterium]
MVKVKKRNIVYAFIDSQNLNLGTSKDIFKNKKLIYKGWKLDFNKFRKYLKDKFKVEKAFLFIGYIEQNKKLYNSLRSYGYILIFKPTVKDNHGIAKGNIDAEIVLHSCAVEYKNGGRR